MEELMQLVLRVLLALCSVGLCAGVIALVVLAQVLVWQDAHKGEKT